MFMLVCSIYTALSPPPPPLSLSPLSSLPLFLPPSPLSLSLSILPPSLPPSPHFLPSLPHSLQKKKQTPATEEAGGCLKCGKDIDYKQVSPLFTMATSPPLPWLPLYRCCCVIGVTKSATPTVNILCSGSSLRANGCVLYVRR